MPFTPIHLRRSRSTEQVQFPNYRTTMHIPNTYLPDYTKIVESIPECTHPYIELRKKTCRNGTFQVRRQCPECGFAEGKVLSSTGINASALPELDEEEKARYISERIERRSQAYDDAKMRSRAEWFKGYNIYLDSAEWKDRRALVLRRDRYICQGCLNASATQVHHLTYENVGEELFFQLISLCGPCHDRIHNDSKELNK